MVKKVGKKLFTRIGTKSESKQVKSPLFEKNGHNFRISGDIQPKRYLTRFVKWPK
jgi:large subunit ribosomal protein L7Ae